MSHEQAVVTEFWRQQENYTYYVVGMSLAAIGFVIVNTKGEPIHWMHIPFALSLISWAISVFSGLKFIKYKISTLYANKGLIEVQTGKHPLSGVNPKKMAIGEEEIKKALMEKELSMGRLATSMNFFFYFGIFSYLFGHILEMYIVS